MTQPNAPQHDMFGSYVAPSTDPGPLPADSLTDAPETIRRRKIAAIHALANWYAAHPQIEMPETVLAYTRRSRHNSGTEFERVMATADFAERTGMQLTDTGTEISARLILHTQDGMRITVSDTAVLDSGHGAGPRTVAEIRADVRHRAGLDRFDALDGGNR